MFLYHLDVSVHNMILNPEVWGPHYWFVLHSIALTYPKKPNAIMRKKYYSFIQDLPLFLPDSKISNQFSHLIKIYSVVPYLDSRDSLMKWLHFIHNKINIAIGKPTMLYQDAIKSYYRNYNLSDLKHYENMRRREKILYGGIILSLCGLSYFLYDK